jgi:LysR family transcriptional regulator, regulator of gene expression of beta-lactamase
LSRNISAALAGVPPQATARYRFDSFVAALGAAEAGAGILRGSRPLIDGALRKKALVTISRVELQSATGHFITHAAGLPLAPDQAAFLAAIMRRASIRLHEVV